MSEILFFTEETDFEILNKSERRDWITSVIHREKKTPGAINVIICSDKYLLQLNQGYLDHDYYTDIITFDYSEGASTLSGDLFISIDRVRENASTYTHHLETELDRVIIHGILHIAGYNDKLPEEVAVMREKEEGYLSLRHY